MKMKKKPCLLIHHVNILLHFIFCSIIIVIRGKREEWVSYEAIGTSAVHIEDVWNSSGVNIAVATV